MKINIFPLELGWQFIDMNVQLLLTLDTSFKSHPAHVKIIITSK